MPRVSKETKEIAEAHRKTMAKAPIFAVWVKRHLRYRDRIDDYEKAYNYVHKGGADEQEATGPRPFNED